MPGPGCGWIFLEVTSQPTTVLILGPFPPVHPPSSHPRGQVIPLPRPRLGKLLLRPSGPCEIWLSFPVKLSSYCCPPCTFYCRHSDLLLFSQCQLLLDPEGLPSPFPLPGMPFPLSSPPHRGFLTAEAGGEPPPCFSALHRPPINVFLSCASFFSLICSVSSTRRQGLRCCVCLPEIPSSLFLCSPCGAISILQRGKLRPATHLLRTDTRSPAQGGLEFFPGPRAFALLVPSAWSTPLALFTSAATTY